MYKKKSVIYVVTHRGFAKFFFGISRMDGSISRSLHDFALTYYSRTSKISAERDHTIIYVQHAAIHSYYILDHIVIIYYNIAVGEQRSFHSSRKNTQNIIKSRKRSPTSPQCRRSDY